MSRRSPSRARRENARTRPLTLTLSVERAPRGATRADVRAVLRRAILNGQQGLGYDLPRGWSVSIGWRNGDGPDRADDWASAMQESAESSRGWDGAVLRYLERAYGNA